MGRLTVCIFVCFMLFFITGCDTHTITTIDVFNNSSYDLHIKFETRSGDRWRPDATYDPEEYKDIDILKNETVSFNLTSFGPSSYRRPYDELLTIRIFHLDTGEIIKTLNVDKNTFKLISSKNDSMGELSAVFLFEITDELLLETK